MYDFMLKVNEMRRLQKEYFRGRDPHTLQACKKAEREVDTILELLKYDKKEPVAYATQPSLFQ